MQWAAEQGRSFSNNFKICRAAASRHDVKGTWDTVIEPSSQAIATVAAAVAIFIFIFTYIMEQMDMHTPDSTIFASSCGSPPGPEPDSP